MLSTISWNDFEKIDMRVGTILHAEMFEGLKNPALKLSIDFGPEIGTLKSSAQITAYYQPGDLVGVQVVAVVNFPPKQISNFFSQCLVLGIYDDRKNVVLLRPDKTVSNGNKIG